MFQLPPKISTIPSCSENEFFGLQSVDQWPSEEPGGRKVQVMSVKVENERASLRGVQ